MTSFRRFRRSRQPRLSRLAGLSLLPFLAPFGLFGVFVFFAAPTRAAAEPEKDLDIRSGERGLMQIFETTNLGPLRRRGMEIGGRERQFERERVTRLRAAGRTALAAVPSWASIGPTYASLPGGTPANAGDTTGLVVDAAFHPADANTVFAATAGGGIWKTADGGTTWLPLMDDLGALPVGAVAVAPSDPTRIYAGTGNLTTGGSQAAIPGFGLLMSTDGGQTWRISAAGVSAGGRFFKILVDPSNPDIVLAAGDRGLMRSTNGGDSFTLVVPVPTMNLARCPGNSAVLYAGTWGAAGSVWKSTDAGATWAEKSAGLPGSTTTRTRPYLGVGSDPNRVYALFSDSSSSTLDMVRSTDGGDTWTALNLATKHVTPLGTQGEYCGAVAVDPQNPDVVYAAGLDSWKSTDAGETWNQVSRWQTAPGAIPYVHADQHNLVFAPNGALFYCTDGGLYRTTNGGQSFASLNRGLVTMQFYDVCQSSAAPDLIMAGAQDNGTTMRTSGTEWRRVVGGDGFGCLVHPTNPQILHASVYYEQILRSINGGATWQDVVNGLTDSGSESDATFMTILRRHPVNVDWIYTASKLKLWKSTNGGTMWTSPSGPIGAGTALVNIRDFSLLPTDGSRILIGGNAALVFESQDDGVTVRKIGTLPVNTISAVRYDRTDVKRIYAASAITTSSSERVWLSTDGGATWKSLSRSGQAGGLPDVPVLTMEQDPKDSQMLWVGTYVGVYRSADGGQTWSRYGADLPNVIVTDIQLYADGTKLRVATFGRGVWEIANVPVGANNPPSAAINSPSSDVTLEAGTGVSFAGAGADPDPADAVSLTFRWDFGDGTTTATGVSPDTHYFASPGTYTVTLTVTDSRGASATATRTVRVTAPTTTGASLFLPVVLESAGASGSFYTSEITIASHSAESRDVLLAYTASVGGGSGFARLTLAPGEQRIIRGSIAFLRTRGLALPDDESPKIGTLLATFSGAVSATDVFLGARTFTQDPHGGPGTFGFFCAAQPATSGSLAVFGLQQNSAGRSNLAVQNAGSSPITLRVRFFGSTGADLGFEDIPLDSYGWYQFFQPLLSRGVSSGRATITRILGSSPFGAYGVLNDAVTSDGSFIPALLSGADSGPAERLVPIVLRTAYSSELTLTNLTASSMALTLVYRATPQTGFNPAGSGTGTVTLDPFEQRVYPDAIAFLRTLGIPIPDDGSDVGGSLLVRAPAGTPAEGLGALARTFTSPGSGTFGLFFDGPTLGESATTTAWIHGLQQGSSQRSNLAIVNRGDAGDSITLRVTYFDPLGNMVGAPDMKTLAPGEWAQFNRPLASRGASAGYARVDRLSGASRFAAYGVLNDQTNSDGSYIPMSR